MTSGKWKKKFCSWIASEEIDQVLPEIASLKGVKQPKEYHSEKDVFTHTLLAVDAVDPICDERVFWAVLLHDIGKVSTTKMIDGRWKAWGHDLVGSNMVPDILKRFDLAHISHDVAWLVKHHGFMLSWGHDLVSLSKKQKRFCNHPLFGLLIEVATADAKASYGNSDKIERLERIVALSMADKY